MTRRRVRRDPAPGQGDGERQQAEQPREALRAVGSAAATPGPAPAPAVGAAAAAAPAPPAAPFTHADVDALVEVARQCASQEELWERLLERFPLTAGRSEHNTRFKALFAVLCPDLKYPKRQRATPHVTRRLFELADKAPGSKPRGPRCPPAAPPAAPPTAGTSSGAGLPERRPMTREQLMQPPPAPRFDDLSQTDQRIVMVQLIASLPWLRDEVAQMGPEEKLQRIKRLCQERLEREQQQRQQAAAGQQPAARPAAAAAAQAQAAALAPQEGAAGDAGAGGAAAGGGPCRATSSARG